MVGIRFDAVEEIIVGGVKQNSDGRQIVAAVAESPAATQNRVQTSAVGSRGHFRPRWRGILNPGNDDGVEYVVQRAGPGWSECRVHATLASRTAGWNTTTATRSRGQQPTRIRRLDARSMSGRGGGADRFRLAVKTISFVLSQFNLRLFSAAHVCR